jgi:hypothetical protein
MRTTLNRQMRTRAKHSMFEPSQQLRQKILNKENRWLPSADLVPFSNGIERGWGARQQRTQRKNSPLPVLCPHTALQCIYLAMAKGSMRRLAYVEEDLANALLSNSRRLTRKRILWPQYKKDRSLWRRTSRSEEPIDIAAAEHVLKGDRKKTESKVGSNLKLNSRRVLPQTRPWCPLLTWVVS